MEDAQLGDVKGVIVAARQHRRAFERRFVERPPSGIELVEAVIQRTKAGTPQTLRLGAAAPSRVIVDPPECPDEPVQDVARRVDQVFFDPDMTQAVANQHSSFGDLVPETAKCAVCARGKSWIAG